MNASPCPEPGRTSSRSSTTSCRSGLRSTPHLPAPSSSRCGSLRRPTASSAGSFPGSPSSCSSRASARASSGRATPYRSLHELRVPAVPHIEREHSSAADRPGRPRDALAGDRRVPLPHRRWQAPDLAAVALPASAVGGSDLGRLPACCKPDGVPARIHQGEGRERRDRRGERTLDLGPRARSARKTEPRRRGDPLPVRPRFVSCLLGRLPAWPVDPDLQLPVRKEGHLEEQPSVAEPRDLRVAVRARAVTDGDVHDLQPEPRGAQQ